jgi:thiol:disulfide interchange protein DsbD
LPPGVRAGEFEWPVPERLPFDSLINYGYRSSVVLPVSLALPPGGTAGPLRIGAALRWLICHDVCIPDKADLELSLPLSDPDRKQLPGWRREIEDARSRVPRPLPETWMAAAVSRGDSFVVSLSMNRPVAATPVLYPIDAGQIDDSAPQEIKISGGALTLTLRKSDQLPAEPEVFRFVLALSSGEGFAAAVPVQKQNGDHSKEKKKK